MTVVFELSNSPTVVTLDREVFAEIVIYAAKECPEMAIGIGSIVDPATAAM